MSNVQFVQVAYGIAIVGLVVYWLSVQRRLRQSAARRSGEAELDGDRPVDELAPH